MCYGRAEENASSENESCFFGDGTYHSISLSSSINRQQFHFSDVRRSHDYLKFTYSKSKLLGVVPRRSTCRTS